MALVDSIDSLIFDYGGVLVKPQSESDQAKMAAVLNVAVERFHDLYWAQRADYDKADLSAEQYWQDIARQARTELDQRALEELIRLDTQSWMQFDEAMWNWLGELRRAGKRLAMLSNMPRELGEALRLTDRLQAFDFVTLSYEVRVVKPVAAIYEYCLDGLDAPACERTLFLDDKIENVQAAEELGIRAMQFLDRDQVLLQLK
ncbi:MAG TPA: HAD family phosphatase [Bryobacteraceae bacterium]|jgi:putative hydrolase of the HAD superfamily|nr:HAD family phosphatase [Bryobacteraceae bacterium]